MLSAESHEIVSDIRELEHRFQVLIVERGLDVDVFFQLKQHRKQLLEERGSILRGIEEALMLTNRRQIASAGAASVPKTFSGAMSW